ncbi:hypothetical protein B0O99DRAFT_184192 [Bisporella sp. PMI_857]|nr:hypothetical protein B0O99DRAFT_184192 [Bisporella sp. PMI_857]
MMTGKVERHGIISVRVDAAVLLMGVAFVSIHGAWLAPSLSIVSSRPSSLFHPVEFPCCITSIASSARITSDSPFEASLPCC